MTRRCKSTENAFVTLLSAVTTFFSVETRDTNMSKINRKTLDALNAHQIRQFDM